MCLISYSPDNIKATRATTNVAKRSEGKTLDSTRHYESGLPVDLYKLIVGSLLLVWFPSWRIFIALPGRDMDTVSHFYTQQQWYHQLEFLVLCNSWMESNQPSN